MSLETLLGFISQYGYFALFFALWLGIAGMPIPDEVVVMTGGMVASLHLLQTVPAFLITYLGVVSGLSIGYVLGRTVGAPILERLKRKKNIETYIKKSEWLLAKYGSYALVISYFFPVVRHVIPYLVGIGKMSFRRYAFFSYGAGLIWTLLFFIVGYLFGDHVEEIGKLAYSYGLYVLAAVAGIGLVVWVVRCSMGKRQQQEREM